MTLSKAIVVHSLAEARRAMAAARADGRAITLLSAPGAARFAGCLWWREMIAIVRAEYPDVEMIDVLDCGDDIAQAWAAVRIGLRHLVLVSLTPEIDALRALAFARGVTLLPARRELD